MAPTAPNLSVGIASFSVSYSAGGILPIMQGHARGLLAKGFDVAAYGINGPSASDDDCDWGHVDVAAYAPEISQFSYAPGLGQALLNCRHDIVHEHGIWLYPTTAVRRWSDRTGKPFVVSTQGMLEPWAMRSKRWKKWIAWNAYERRNVLAADCLHASAQEVAGIRSLGLRNPIAVIPNGVDLPELESPVDRPSFLAGDDRKVLLFLGRIHPKKGVQELLEAWSLAVAQSQTLREEWVLVVAGWGEEHHVAREMQRARLLGLERSVLFPGPVFGTDKEALFHHSRAFILASHSEGLPMAVLEAWSYAKPVFMTPGCNLPEGFSHDAAIEIDLVPGAIANTLVAHLLQGGLDPIGQAGRRLVQDRFSWSKVADDLVAVYEWLVHGGQVPSCVSFS